MRNWLKLLAVPLLSALLGAFSAAPVFAAEDLAPWLTELAVGDIAWSYGGGSVSCTVNTDEMEKLRLTAFFTGKEWKELAEQNGGSISLVYHCEEGITVRAVNASVVTAENEKKTVGTAEVSGQDVFVKFGSDAASSIAAKENIELRVMLAAEFSEEREYDLDEHLIVTAKESAASVIRWNGYEAYLKKYDAEDDTKLLAGAEFAISRYSWKDDAWSESAVQIGSAESDTEPAKFLTNGIRPGAVYSLEEIRAPFGFLPSTDKIYVAFDYRSDSEKEGTQNKIGALNYTWHERYAKFGHEVQLLENGGTVYAANRKYPELLLRKVDADTGIALSEVPFTLTVSCSGSGYGRKEFEEAGWTVDDSGTATLSGTTKADGTVWFDRGVFPYMSGSSWTLTETVPAGYKGSGGKKSFTFTMDRSGLWQSENDDVSAAMNAEGTVLEVIVKNHKRNSGGGGGGNGGGGGGNGGGGKGGNNPPETTPAESQPDRGTGNGRNLPGENTGVLGAVAGLAKTGQIATLMIIPLMLAGAGVLFYLYPRKKKKRARKKTDPKEKKNNKKES